VLPAIIIGAILSALLFPRFLRRVNSKASEQELVRRCKGDVAQAGRLIDLEMRRRAGMPRGEAAARALERLKYDNR
jgi:hypothetical protein